MKVYYAHSIHVYNTPQEKRDITLLESLGFEVYNPNNEEARLGLEKWKSDGKHTMWFFKKLIDDCDFLAYRSHPDLSIPSGVFFEIQHAIEKKKQIIELPTITSKRVLTYEDTLKYLEYNGQR